MKTMIKKLLTLVIASVLSTAVMAQNANITPRTYTGGIGASNTNKFVKCGTQVPSNAWEQELQKQIAVFKANQTKNKGAQVVLTIPIVVHVIHSGGAVGSGDNISDAQINSQVTVLNDDYNGSGLNAVNVPSAFASLKANTGINFCMAQRTPQGNPMANPGIDRVSYASKGFTAPGFSGYSTSYIDATIKPATIWDVTKYLNVWVLDLDNTLLGYATFPSAGSVSNIPGQFSGTTTTDGFVNDYQGWGVTGAGNAPYNKGRTATHEIGHWLGLRHINGDGACADDYCNDTPDQQDLNYGCVTYPHVTCGNSGDMSMNFMDYSDDPCMYMFTNDQKTRMLTVLANDPWRANMTLQNNLSCTPVNVNIPPVADFTPSKLNPVLTNIVTLTNNTTNATSYNWTVSPSTGANLSSSTAVNPTLTFTATGTYTVCLTATNSFGTSPAFCKTIQVFSGAQSTTCDTLNNINLGVDTITYYRLGPLASDGYLTGQNKYNNTAFAERFDYPLAGFTAGLKITGLYVYHAVIKGTGSTQYKIWLENAGLPSSAVSAAKGVVNNTLTPLSLNAIMFNTPLNIAAGAPFYAGYSFAKASGDTIAVVQTKTGSPAATGYEQRANAWLPFSSATGYNIKTSLFVLPIICPLGANGINEANQALLNNAYVFPNPSNGLFNVMLIFDTQTDATVTVTDLLGKQLLTQNVHNVIQKELAVDLSAQGKGTYFVTIKTINGVTTKRVIISE
jgi:PKD repeat protein